MEDEEKRKETTKEESYTERRLTVNKLEVYGRQLGGREYKDLSSMNMEMTKSR